MVIRFQYNDPTMIERRKRLRNNSTKAEIRLWGMLKNSKLEKRKFRRQYGVGPYILDFYCPQERLAVELDGASHNSEAAYRYDQQRTAYLNGLDIKVIRFENYLIFKEADWVLDQIVKCFGDHPDSTTRRATPPT